MTKVTDYSKLASWTCYPSLGPFKCSTLYSLQRKTWKNLFSFWYDLIPYCMSLCTLLYQCYCRKISENPSSITEITIKVQKSKFIARNRHVPFISCWFANFCQNWQLLHVKLNLSWVSKTANYCDRIVGKERLILLRRDIFIHVLLYSSPPLRFHHFGYKV